MGTGKHHSLDHDSGPTVGAVTWPELLEVGFGVLTEFGEELSFIDYRQESTRTFGVCVVHTAVLGDVQCQKVPQHTLQGHNREDGSGI